MKALVGGLLASRAFPDALHPNSPRREPVLDQEPRGLLHFTASTRIRIARITRFFFPFTMSPNHQAASGPSEW
jgi:hypothetical protein